LVPYLVFSYIHAYDNHPYMRRKTKHYKGNIIAPKFKFLYLSLSCINCSLTVAVVVDAFSARMKSVYKDETLILSSLVLSYD
jgi:hypothetical protein